MSARRETEVKARWIKVEPQDGGTAFLATIYNGINKAFSDQGRALAFAESYIGTALDKVEPMIGAEYYYAEVAD